MLHCIKSARTTAAMAVLALGLTAPAAQAQVYSNGNATATFLVTLNIVANCSIAANPLTFGVAGTLSSPVVGTSTLTVRCTSTTPYNVGLNGGNVANSTVTARLLAGTATGNTTTTVPFQLYQDSAHNTIWGNTQGTNTQGGVGTGTAQTLTVYGLVAAQPTVPVPDSYQSTVTATVYF